MEEILKDEDYILTEEPITFNMPKPEKCFCHLNGYKVKDADARRMLSGNASMGDIKVSSIKSKNFINVPSDLSVTGYNIYKVSIPSNTYVLSAEAIETTSETYQLIRFVYDDGTSYNAGLTKDELVKTITLAKDVVSLYIYSSDKASTSTSITSIFKNLMLSLDGGEYAPYFDLDSKDYIEGNASMGDIKVSSIRSKNLINSLSKTGKVIYFNGTSSYTDYIFEPGTYTLSYKDDNQRSLFIQNEDIEATNLGKNKAITFSSEKPFNIWLYGDGITLEEISEIQLEVGSQATEYTPHFELATKEDLKGSCYYEMPLPLLVTGEDYSYQNIINDESCIKVAKEIIEKLKIDNIDKPNITIVNTTDSIVHEGETIENPSPRQINLSYMNHVVFESGIESYCLHGISDFYGTGVSTDPDTEGFSDGLTPINEVAMDIQGTWEGNEFTVTSLQMNRMKYQLPSKKYVDNLVTGGTSNDIPDTLAPIFNITGINFVEKDNMFSNVTDTTNDDLAQSFQKMYAYCKAHNISQPIITTNHGIGLTSHNILTSNNISFSFIRKRSYSTNVKLHNLTLDFTLTKTDDVITQVRYVVRTNLGDYLCLENTSEYTPTLDYHPATKKYVDEMINALRDELSGS